MAFLEPLRMAASQLGVTDSQKDQIKAIADSHADEWRGLADRERQARQALQTAIAAPQFDEVTIRQRSAELGAIEADAAVARARVRAEVFQVLTPDQQAKMKELESQGPRGRGPLGRRD
jgi:protein CpxP